MTDMADQTVFLPKTIGPYRIEREIGAGAMGTVFQAVHSRLERVVALKVLRPDMLEDPDAVRRFLREARSVARLEHPHIVSVYDAGEADGLQYIAMKLLEGETLQSLLATSGPMPIERAVWIATQIAWALDDAHRQDVVHLDVKPANVVVGKDDWVTLTDFGISRALNPGATRTATIAGTPLYMSPEQIDGREVDSRADLYSLGLVLYQMCAGNPPFQGQFVTVMYAHLHTPPPDVRAAREGIPDPLAAIIQRALAKNPEERFQTAGEMAEALEDLLPDRLKGTARTPPAQREEAAPEAGAKAIPRPATGRRIYVLGGIAAVVLAALVAGILVLTRSGGASPGKLQVSSVPLGASVLLDGKARGRTPLTLDKITSGSHQLSLSYPTYDPSTVRVTVKSGQTTSFRWSLRSWPIKRLVSVDLALVTTSVHTVGQQIRVGPSVSTLSASRFSVSTLYAVSQLRLAPGARNYRDVTIAPEWQLIEPNGYQVQTSRSGRQTVTLKRGGTPAPFISTFALTSSVKPPVGRWQLRLVTSGQVLRTLGFSVTR